MSGLADIEACCERLTSLLEDALVGTRSNGLTPRLSIMSVGSVLATAQKQVRKSGEARGVTIEIAEGPEVAAILDRALLTRAMVKLLDRAIAESQPGATISVHYRLEDEVISISVNRGGPLVSIRPSAPAPESAERVKVQSSDLIFCRMVAESHGGALSLGSGSTMYRICLPWIGPEDR
jgi:K+-sensing histidine kinase KdpD